MFTDADLEGLQRDFGTLTARTACQIKRGTLRGTSQVYGAPFNVKANHYCTVLTPAEIKDAYITSWVRSMAQETKNARVILMPLPIPNNLTLRRGDIIVTGSGALAVDYTILDLGNDMSYQYQKVLFCQMAENENV